MRLALSIALMALASASPVALIAPAHAADGPERAFTGEDLFKLEGASGPQISPDGSKIAYVRLSNDIMTDKTVPSIWIIDVKSGRQEPLITGPGAHFSPRWSPDGKRLAFVSSTGDGPPQLYVRWMDTGASVKVTGLPDSPGGISWSPDGSMVAYTMRVPGDPMKLGSAPAKPEGAKWAKPLEVIDKVT